MQIDRERERIQEMLKEVNFITKQVFERLISLESNQAARRKWKRMKRETDSEWLEREREKNRERERLKRDQRHEAENQRRIAAGLEPLAKRTPGRPRKEYNVVPPAAGPDAQ